MIISEPSCQIRLPCKVGRRVAISIVVAWLLMPPVSVFGQMLPGFPPPDPSSGERLIFNVPLNDPRVPKPAGDGVGAFRVPCTVSTFGAFDPIVSPGRPGASHMHTFFGNTAVNPSSVPRSLKENGRSTCAGGIVNRSAYWVPTLFDQDGKPRKPVVNFVYYKSGYNGISAGEISPTLPAELRVISNAMPTATHRLGVANDVLRTNDPRKQFWACGLGNGIRYEAIPRCETTMLTIDGRTIQAQYLLMVVKFPQCWNGRSSSPDHRSHLSYTSGRRCPASHPIALPVITYNVRYLFYPADDTTQWYLASDRNAGQGRLYRGGYSVHGDWMNGWDDNVTRTWLRDCVRAKKSCSRQIEKTRNAWKILSVLNDDNTGGGPRQTLTIEDATVREGDGAVTVPVTLSSAAQENVSVSVYTRNGTARGGQDYYGFTRRLTIPRGSRQTRVALSVIDDQSRENTETMQLKLINASNAEIADDTANITILDDDNANPSARLTISDVRVNERDGSATLTVFASPPVDATVRVFTRAGSAKAPEDYYGFSKKLEFTPRRGQAAVTVTLVDNDKREPVENLSVQLFSAEGAVIGRAFGIITITDDD